MFIISVFLGQELGSSLAGWFWLMVSQETTVSQGLTGEDVLLSTGPHHTGLVIGV
jgi:hypothetical protein